MSRHPGAERAAKPSTPNRIPPTFSRRVPRCASRLLLPTLGVAGTWFILACGVQGPPQPPRVERPEAVKDLTVSQVGRTFLLTFTLPQLATDGERLTKSIEARLFRAIYPAGGNAAGGPPEDVWRVLKPEELAGHARNEKATFPARLSEQEVAQWRDATFAFSLTTLTRGFRRRPVESEPSNTVRARLLAVSGPVQDLRIIPGEKALELTWSPPRRSANEAKVPEPSGCRVYRSRSGEPGSYELLGETASMNYADPDFEFDRPLFYRVRAVFRDGDQVAESEDSAVVPITPRDVYPPGVPAGLSGVYTGQGVELIWTPNLEADLAGYNVYRREPDGAFRKINQDLLITPIFRDASAQAGRSYFYRVTAVDLTGNESAPSEEFRVESR